MRPECPASSAHPTSPERSRSQTTDLIHKRPSPPPTSPSYPIGLTMANMECPLCYGSFPNSKIEAHAARCTGELPLPPQTGK